MVTDQQIRRLYKLSNTEDTQAIAASKAGMDVKTARKYLRARRLPSEMKADRHWRTGPDGFAEGWPGLGGQIRRSPRPAAKRLLAGVPLLHRTDRMTAAVNNLTEQADFQKSYQTLLRHYGLEGRRIQTGCPNENGDVEQRHYRLYRAMDQALLLRGSREFAAVDEYR